MDAGPKSRNLPRVAGHKAGIEPVRVTVETCARLGLRALTLYAFSVENWKRPRAEVEMLWRLLRIYLRAELPDMARNDIRFNAIGRIEALPDFVRAELEETIRATARNRGLQLNLAINYGGRAELVDAVKALVEDARRRDRRDRRRGDRRPPVYRRNPRSRPPDPHLRRNARQQFSALADRLFRAVRHRYAVARFQPHAIFCARFSIIRSATGASAGWATLRR